MSIEADIRTQLTSNANLAAVVAARVYGGGIASRLGGMPLVTVELTAGPLNYTHDGLEPRREDTFAITGWDDDYANAIALQELILAALPVDGGTWGSSTVQTCFCKQRDDVTTYDPQTDTAYFGRRLLFAITYEVSA
jgi:hypothetical protein